MMQSVICSSQSSVHVSFQPLPLDTLIGYLTSYNTSNDVCLFLSTRHPTLSPPSMCVRGDARDSLPHTLCFNSFFPPLTARGRNNGIGKPLLPYAKTIQPNQCPEINTKARACQPPITCLGARCTSEPLSVETAPSRADSATSECSARRSRRCNKPSLSCLLCTQKKTKVRAVVQG